MTLLIGRKYRWTGSKKLPYYFSGEMKRLLTGEPLTVIYYNPRSIFSDFPIQINFAECRNEHTGWVFTPAHARLFRLCEEQLLFPGFEK